MGSDMAREPLDELYEELQTVASLVKLHIKNQQQVGADQDASGAFDCSGDAERRFEVQWQASFLSIFGSHSFFSAVARSDS